MKPIRVLLVEDDELTRKTVKEALINEGLDVEFDTGKVVEAIEFAKKYAKKIEEANNSWPPK